ncbi:UNVERIFIED_CONTAM: hypothetical protein GTU68_017897 [Idotea baltica]|nr:hypothetical protein [Idotea baltica]
MAGIKLIECVPNFSEGRDMKVIKQITDEIEKIEGVQLLDVDPGKATNRTVVTFVGPPNAVVEAAYQAIKKASEVIDMSKHNGEHPRMGATDVCPFIPISNVTMEEVVECAKKLGEKAGSTLEIPFYLYESAATHADRKNLATVRAGEYEGLPKKLKDPHWKPDYGPSSFNPKTGATAIGARDFLVAYNVNLNTTSVRRANSVAFDVREKGEPLRVPGKLKSVKAIGWYIDEYNLAQISMNLTNISITSLHEAFEACRESANNKGMRVTGSELVGLVPKKVLVDAGKFFLAKQERSLGVSDEELIHIAIKSLGLDELGPFDPKKKVIEYLLKDDNQNLLVDKNLTEFANETASESPAPGGGSIAAYLGALGVSLGTMVANLSSHKRGWDDRWEEFSQAAEVGQMLKDKLLHLVDADTAAFNGIIAAVRMPKGTATEKSTRADAMEAATKHAIEVPLDVMRTSFACFNLLSQMAESGNPNSVSDAGVGALCCKSAVHGAYLNVKINCKDLDDKKYVKDVLAEADDILTQTKKHEKEILKMVEEKL